MGIEKETKVQWRCSDDTVHEHEHNAVIQEVAIKFAEFLYGSSNHLYEHGLPAGVVVRDCIGNLDTLIALRQEVAEGFDKEETQ